MTSIAILFLAHQGVHTADQWVEWKGLPGGDRFTFHVLIEKPLHGVDFCTQYELTGVPATRTRWGGVSVVKRTILAYRAILQSLPLTSHIVLCSGACAPVRPPSDLLHAVLELQDSSAFAFVRDKDVDIITSRGGFVCRPHTQWTIICQADARALIGFQDWAWLSRCAARLDIEAFACAPDEWMPYAILTMNKRVCRVVSDALTHCEWGRNTVHPITWRSLEGKHWSARHHAYISLTQLLHELRDTKAHIIRKFIGTESLLR